MLTGRRLIFADGTVIEGGEAGYTSGVLWCYIKGKPLAEVGPVFLDSTKTAVIRFQYGEMEDRHDGFTECFFMNVNDGKCTVGLTRPQEES